MDWNLVVSNYKQGFQNALVDMNGTIDKTKMFIEELKFFKFDLSNDMILYGMMQEPLIITTLYTLYESSVLKKIQKHITIIKNKHCTVNITEQHQIELVAMTGDRERALDFLKELKQLGLDLTEDNKLALMHEEAESFRLLSIYFGLGFISKLIRTQQAIEIILKKENII